jgi:hypothetical protein
MRIRTNGNKIDGKITPARIVGLCLTILIFSSVRSTSVDKKLTKDQLVFF